MPDTHDGMFAGPAAAARRLGVSIKALRVYEARGLLTPKRTRKGWRCYTPEDLDRLSGALAFKAMGFGLTQIASLLDAGADDIAAALVAQERQLKARRAALDEALEAVRDARRIGAPALRLAA